MLPLSPSVLQLSILRYAIGIGLHALATLRYNKYGCHFITIIQPHILLSMIQRKLSSCTYMQYYTFIPVLSSLLDLCCLLTFRHLRISVVYNTTVLKKKGNPLEKHLQCEKVLGLAGGNTKKRGNKKSGESNNSNPLQLMNMYS